MRQTFIQISTWFISIRSIISIEMLTIPVRQKSTRNSSSERISEDKETLGTQTLRCVIEVEKAKLQLFDLLEVLLASKQACTRR